MQQKKLKSKLRESNTNTDVDRTMKFGMFSSPAPLAIGDDSMFPTKKGK